MALPTCDCVSVDSPLSTTAATLSIVTFAIAVAGGILALIAIAKSWRNAAGDVLRYLENYDTTAKEVELFRIAYGIAPEFFPSQGQGAASRHRDAREVRRNQIKEAAEHILDKISDSTVDVAAGLGKLNQEENIRNRGKAYYDKMGWYRKFIWMMKSHELMEKMQQRITLTPSLLMIRMELLALRIDTIGNQVHNLSVKAGLEQPENVIVEAKDSILPVVESTRNL